MKTIIVVLSIIVVIVILIFIFFSIRRKKLRKFNSIHKRKVDYPKEKSNKSKRLFDFDEDDSLSNQMHELDSELFNEEVRHLSNELELQIDHVDVCCAHVKNAINRNSELSKYSDLADAFLLKLPNGYLHFAPPERMKLGKKIMLEANLAKQIDFFKKEIKLDDLDTLPIATEMGVKLEGDHFEIKELSQQYKIINNSGPTSWVWKIKPTSAGAQELYLTVLIKLKFENYSDTTQERPMYIKTIKVTVNPIYSIKHFFSNNWKWIISTLFGSGIVFALLKSLKIIE